MSFLPTFAMVTPRLILMVKLSFLTQHVTASAFPGTRLFAEIVFSFAFVAFPRLRRPQLASEQGQSANLWSAPRVASRVSAVRSGCPAAIDVRARSKGRLRKRETFCPTAEGKWSGVTSWKGRSVVSVSCDVVVLKRLEEPVCSLTQDGEFCRHGCVLENRGKREKRVVLCSLRSGLWVDQRSILISNPSWFWNSLELEENLFKTCKRKVLFFHCGSEVLELPVSGGCGDRQRQPIQKGIKQIHG